MFTLHHLSEKWIHTYKYACNRERFTPAFDSIRKILSSDQTGKGMTEKFFTGAKPFLKAHMNLVDHGNKDANVLDGKFELAML
jgi:hypothetical protein